MLNYLVKKSTALAKTSPNLHRYVIRTDRLSTLHSSPHFLLTGPLYFLSRNLSIICLPSSHVALTSSLQNTPSIFSVDSMFRFLSLIVPKGFTSSPALSQLMQVLFSFLRLPLIQPTLFIPLVITLFLYFLVLPHPSFSVQRIQSCQHLLDSFPQHLGCSVPVIW